jgi:hypothetical protein
MDEQIIADIVKQIQESKMPEWWLNYAGQIAYNLQVHTKGLMFDKITGLYPNEHPDSQKHCINSYESITKGSIWKSINNIIRVFNNSSYNVNISDKTKKALEDYDGSLFSQFLEDWIRYAVADDPNGICVTYPLGYTDDLYRYICHKELVKVSDDILIFISAEESEVKIEMSDVEYGKDIFIDYTYAAEGQPNVRHTTTRTFNRRLEKKIINPVYHVFTKTHFIRFFKTQAGDKEFQYEYIQFPKELPSLPYFENGGVEIEEEIYESFIQAFIPFGNLALMSHRNHRAVDLMFSYPRMSEVQQPCDECSGRGETHCTTSTTGWETCKTCKGSKYVTIQSPYKTYRKVQDSFDTDNKVFSTPSVEFYSPDSAILDYSKNQWKDYLAEAEAAVFVQQKTDTGNTEAAKSKEIDREELYSWLANISKVLYNNMEMFLQYLENYINSSPIKVSIEAPYSFAILTESEAFAALDTMLASNSPIPIKANQVDSFVNKFISESSPVKRALTILKKFDLLLYYSNDEVSNLKGQGTVSAVMVQNHTLAYPVLVQMYELDNNLFDLTDDQIIIKLEKELTKYDLTKDLKTTVLNA